MGKRKGRPVGFKESEETKAKRKANKEKMGAHASRRKTEGEELNQYAGDADYHVSRGEGRVQPRFIDKDDQ